MTDFAIGRYGSGDWRLVKWDGSTETEIGSGWDHRPELDEILTAVMDHHGVGSSPFSSRESTVDSMLVTNAHPLPNRDMTLDDETMPWNDPVQF